MKKDLDIELRRYFGRKLRQLYQRSPLKKWAFAAHGSRCAVCKTEFPRGDLQIDHVIPVSPVDREVGSFEYFLRMFSFTLSGEVDIDNLVPNCLDCHNRKSAAEMAERAANRTGPYSKAAYERRKATRARNAKKKTKRKSRR